MDITITKSEFPKVTYYDVIKWDGFTPVETFRTKKKNLAHKKFTEFSRNINN